MPATAATRPWGPSRTSRPSPNSCREGPAMPIRSVGIIGAGFAGLSTAKVLRAFGFEVTVFEKEPDVGGVWAASRRYPGLTTQNPRTTYALSDFPMPASYPEWPSGQQVQAYLQSYAEHFGLVPFLRMSTTVESAVLDEEAGVWTVQARGKHVLVVGYGKASCDVANAIAADSASTTVLARHLIWKIPKKFMNVLN